MENNISDRIRFIIKELGHNNNSFSKAIGLSNNVTIGRIINENREPSFDTIEKILLTFGSINANWLIKGTGEPFREDKVYNKMVSEPKPNYETSSLHLLQSIIKEKEKEISELNRYIGKLIYQIDELNTKINNK